MLPARIPFVWMLSVFACFGQASLDVHFGEHAAGFWGRYVLLTDKGRRSGWVVAERGAEVETLTGVPAGAGTRLKAIFYAPGCALQLVDMPINEGRPYQYFFPCEALARVEIEGMVPRRNDPWLGLNVTVNAKYVATWASRFFGYDDGTTTEIPLEGEAKWQSDSRFRLSIPDFARDSVAGSADHEGEVRIWVRNLANGQIVDQLRVSPHSPEDQRTKLGGIPITSLHTPPVLFTFTLCPVVSRFAHDQYGFAKRDGADGCGSP